MATEQEKSAVYKMLAVYAAGIFVIIVALYLMGGDVMSCIIGFVFAFIGIAILVAAGRMAKKIKKEQLQQ